MKKTTTDNRIFALVITSPNAAKTFYDKFNDSISIKELKYMCHENWKELYSYNKGNYNQQTTSLYALSTLLNTFNSSIQVMADTIINNKRTFKLYKGQRTNILGTKVIKRTKCK